MPEAATSQEEFNAASPSIQNTPGSNLYETTKKINPKTKSYSGGGEGKEVAPKISVGTFPLSPAVGWGVSTLMGLSRGDVSTSFCTFLLLGEGPSDQRAEFWEFWVRTMRIWVLERGQLLVGSLLQGKGGWLAPKDHGPPPVPHLLCSPLPWWL